MRIKYNYRRSFSSKIDLKMKKNRNINKKNLARPKKTPKNCRRPVQLENRSPVLLYGGGGIKHPNYN